MSSDSPAIRQFVVAADDDGIRLDRWFKRHLPEASFNVVSRWARTGQLRVDGARATPGDRVTEGQVIRVPPAEPPAQAKPRVERPKLSEEQVAFARELLIHRDAAALVINKPPGLATQGGTKTKDHVDGLLDALQFDAEGRPKLVHRLDKDTSGALLLARTTRAAAYFSKHFSGRSASKLYWALVVGVPSIEDGVIDLPIGKQPGTGGEKMHVDEAEGQPARTRYRVVEQAGNRAAWVELQPFTGRTHQLRVHLAAIGHPIVGDGKYGGQDAFLTGGISRKMHLHSRRIRIDHPDGGKLDVTAELPRHFAESMAMLGFEEANGERGLIDETRPPPTREQQKAKAKAHAKTVRKERRGRTPFAHTPVNRLALFDCDGTLVDSQATICRAMEDAFAGARLEPPGRAAIRRIVGLSLVPAIAELLPEAEPALHLRLAEDYKAAFFKLRSAGLAEEPLFDGIAEVVRALDDSGWLLGVATGKSDRGLNHVLALHGLKHHFVTLQTADRHPSKPHPAMIAAAMAEAGACPETTAMIGDTSFDMAMATAAGAHGVGVAWGYHAPDELTAAGARVIADHAHALPAHLEAL